MHQETRAFPAHMR